VRDRYAAAQTSRAQSLALQQRIEDFALLDAGRFGSAKGEFLKSLLLALGFERGDDPVRRQQITKIHVQPSHPKKSRPGRPSAA